MFTLSDQNRYTEYFDIYYEWKLKTPQENRNNILNNSKHPKKLRILERKRQATAPALEQWYARRDRSTFFPRKLTSLSNCIRIHRILPAVKILCLTIIIEKIDFTKNPYNLSK